MLVEFNFHLTQVNYIRAAMAVIPVYKPDDSTVSIVDSIIGSAKVVRQDYVAKFNALNSARGATQAAHAALHDACVSVYQCMKSCYRKDPASLNCIESLPVQDQSYDETITRALGISEAWAGLPNPPGWAGPFKVGLLTRTAFDTLKTAFDSAQIAEAAADQPFQLREGFLHAQQQVLADFAAAALAQGRGQFPEGTAERETIDRVPTAPATQEPGQAEVTKAESPAAGAVRLEFDAPHATSFQAWRQGPGESEFTLVEEDLLKPGVYTATGLAAGEYRYKVVGVNSRGEGPASTEAVINVAQAQAA